jgi:hypothetical protein
MLRIDAFDAEIVHIKDFDPDTESVPIGNIALDISPDHKVHFNSLFGDYELKNGVLTIVNYYGKVLVPKHAGINITNTPKSISGKVANPINIASSGDITLRIMKEANLELCLEARGQFTLNDNLIAPIPEDIYTYGELDYQNFVKRYECTPISEKRKDPLYNIGVCMHYNLINIYNDGGTIKLDYDSLPRNTPEERVNAHKKSICLRLEREIEWARINEDYSKAARAHKELSYINDSFKVPVISSNQNKQ